MKLTKHKDPQGWRVHIDGKPTSLVISKGFAPRYREPQMYDLTTDQDGYIMEAPGVGAVMDRLERLLRELSPEVR